MANKSLIDGAALVGASKHSTWGQAFQEGLNNSLAAGAQSRAIREAKKAQINSKVANYIDTLNSEFDVTQLTPTQQSSVKNYLVEQKRVYADTAMRVAKLDADNPMYMEGVSQLNSIKSNFTNLASELNAFKEDKLNYVKDFDNGTLSEGNKIGTLSDASGIYTGESTMSIGQGGGINFWNEENGEFKSYRQTKKPFLKDFGAADSIMKINENVYSSGKVLQGARKNMIRQQVSQLIDKGGRNSLLSLASDDFVVQGGLNLEDPSLFEPENEALLKDAVLSSYMNAFTESSIQGANDKRPASTRGGGGYSGAVRDEINLGGPRAQEALQLSQTTSGDATSIARTANAMDPTDKNIKYKSRAEFYKEFIDGQELKDNEESQKEFTDMYGNSEMFRYNYSNPSYSRGISVDINDPQSIYRFYIQNSDFGGKAENHFINNYPSNNNNSSGSNANSGSLDNL